MTNDPKMHFLLEGTEPLDLEDLANQLHQGRSIFFNGEEIGKTSRAQVVPKGIEVSIELTHPYSLPRIVDLKLRASIRDMSAPIGSSLNVDKVEAITKDANG